MIYDNHDARLRYFELLLKRDNLENIPEFRLPDGYRFVLYQSGDRDDWIELGYTHAKIPTQTNTWLACKIYLDFGFVPVPENAVHSRDGWRMIRTLTKHAALKGFEELPRKELTKGTGQTDS